MDDCFILTNIAPQNNSLNTGDGTLRGKERQWAKRDSAIIIVAGPIYESADTQRIGTTGVRVPGAFFKNARRPYAEKPRGIAFVYPNMASPGNMENYAMSIRELEQITGYDFLMPPPRLDRGHYRIISIFQRMEQTELNGTTADTIVALATPPGTGGIAVVRLSGPDAVAIADSVWRGKVVIGWRRAIPLTSVKLSVKTGIR